MNKKGQMDFKFVGLMVAGIAGLIVTAIIAFVIVSNVTNANLLSGTRPTITVLNEKGFAAPVHANLTGYTLSGWNSSWSAITITAAKNSSSYGAGGGQWNITISNPSGNISISTLGVLNNATSAHSWNNISINYTYNYLSSEELSSSALSGNFTAGVNNVSSKLPTVLLVAAIVLILSTLAILVGVWQRMKMGGSI